jgi:hypothetical protein
MTIRQKSVQTKASNPSREERRLKWAGLIREWKMSGLSKREFCKNHNINRRTFEYQVAKSLGKPLSEVPAPASTPPQFMKVKLPMPQTSVAPNDSLELRLSCGAQLIFNGWSNTKAVLEVIRGLIAC